jgi:ketopantoate reductase
MGWESGLGERRRLCLSCVAAPVCLLVRMRVSACAAAPVCLLVCTRVGRACLRV